MHFLYVFIPQFCTVLHVSNDHFIHHQEFMIYCILQLCTNHANVPGHVCMVCTELQNTVNHKLLMVNEMIVRNM